MNGADIISREVGEHIKNVDEAEPHNRSCEFSRSAKPAIKLSLRLGEEAMRFQRLNVVMFIVIMASTVEVQNKNGLEWLLGLILGK